MQSRLIYPHTFVPKIFGQINEMCGLVRHLVSQDGSYTKRADHETARLLKTDKRDMTVFVRT